VYENASALVLSSRRSGEKDKRLGLYTREQGRLRALAVGAARPGAKLGPATETAVEADFRLWREPGALHARVTGGAVKRSFPALRARWERMAAAQFLCEWTERLTAAAEPHPDKYDLLISSLGRLESEDPVAVKLSFQSRFLALAGYNPVRDVPGLSAVPGAETIVGIWASGETGPVPAGLPAPYLQQQLLKFVSPLLTGPLRAGVHEENLKKYQEKVVAPAKAGARRS
jgi:hypothetical protein